MHEREGPVRKKLLTVRSANKSIESVPAQPKFGTNITGKGMFIILK